MLLDKTSSELIQYLIELEQPETIMTISKSIHQSRRKIYHHLDNINDALGDQVPDIVSQPRVGVLLTTKQKSACEALLKNANVHQYIMSVEERVQLMMLYICIAQDRVTIERLMTLTDVSRNTILNDLNLIRHHLSMDQYKVTLTATKRRGYVLECGPLNKIQYTQSLLYHVFNEGNPIFIQMTKDKMTAIVSEKRLFSQTVYMFLRQQVPQVERDLGKKINRYEIAFMLNMVPYLLLSCRNIYPPCHDECNSQEFNLIHQRKEYIVAKQLSYLLMDVCSVQLSEMEQSLLAILLLSYRKDKDTHASSQDFAQLADDLRAFLRAFEHHIETPIEHPDDVLRNLVTHCKALLFRKTYGIFSKNPLTYQIKTTYPDVYACTKQCSQQLEEAWLIDFTDDEIAYLAIHLGGAIRYRRNRIQLDKKRLYIVCDEGVGVSKLLLKQCQHHVRDSMVEAVFTTDQFMSVRDILTADLIITTNPKLETIKPVLYVNPVLSSDDMLQLMYYTQHGVLRSSVDYFDQDLTKLVNQYISDEEAASALTEQIQRLVQQTLLSQLMKETS